DDRVRRIVDAKHAPDDVRRAAVLPLPEPVAQDDDVRRAGILLVERERPAERWTGAERVEDRRRDTQPGDELRAARSANRDAAAGERADGLEAARPRPVDEVRV